MTTTSVQPDTTTTATVNSTTHDFALSHCRDKLSVNVLSDEFNGTSIDASKWNKVGPWGNPVASGWANFSYHARRMFRRPTARPRSRLQNTGGGPTGTWTGGVLSTNTTKLFQYGFFEAHAKLPARSRLLASHLAVWVELDGDELDIMEFLGGDITTVLSDHAREYPVAVAGFARRAQIGQWLPFVPDAVGARSGHLLYR